MQYTVDLAKIVCYIGDSDTRPYHETNALEQTVMNLIHARPRPGQIRMSILMIMGLLSPVIPPGALPQLASRPASGQVSTGADSYIGIWRLSFHGNQVGVLEFMKYKDQLTGSLTNMHGKIGADGAISIYQVPGSAPVVETSMSQGGLHFVVVEPRVPINFEMTLDGTDKAHLVYFRSNGETLKLELTRVSEDENNAEVAH
jgi:hypothetical protein